MGDGLPTGDPLHPVPLQELQLLEQGKHWSIDQRLSELDSLTPVRGHLHAVHRGNVLELDGEANTIVTLCCCLLYTSPSPRDRQKSRMPSSA